MVKFHTVLRGNQAAAVVQRPLDHGIGYIGALLRLHIDDERQRIAARSDSLEPDVECRDTFRNRFFLGVFPADSETVRLYFIIPWEGCETRMPLFSHCQSEYMHVWKKNNDEIKPSPRGEGGERSEPDRVLAV